MNWVLKVIPTHPTPLRATYLAILCNLLVKPFEDRETFWALLNLLNNPAFAKLLNFISLLMACSLAMCLLEAIRTVWKFALVTLYSTCLSIFILLFKDVITVGSWTEESILVPHKNFVLLVFAILLEAVLCRNVLNLVDCGLHLASRLWTLQIITFVLVLNLLPKCFTKAICAENMATF